MKRKLFVLLIFLLFYTQGYGLTKELSVVCDIWPPYQIKENSHITGYSFEVVNSVFEKMNLKNMTISGYPWKRAVYMLKEGQADALFSANYTEEREKYAIYPKEPLIVSPWVVWVRTDSNIQFNVLNDLKGLNCGVVRGYSYTPEFWDFLKTKGRFSLVSDDETNFKKLGAKRIDYTVSELGNGLEIIKRLNLKDIIPLAGNPIKKDGLYIIFNKKTVSVEFADKFSQVLKEFKKTKDYKNIYNKYFR